MKLSIVIAAWNGNSSLEKCLRSLESNTLGDDIEVIVVSNFHPAAPFNTFNASFEVRFIESPSDTPVPILRTIGIKAAAGEVIALAEDHCTFDANWCSELKKAHQSHHAAIGGAVENASNRYALDWAVYFYDYGRFMLPCPKGTVPSLSGINVSYKKSILLDIEPSFRHGFFEPVAHDQLLKRGCPLYLEPSAVVYHDKSYDLKSAATDAYHHGRGFGGKRLSNAPLLKRAVFSLGSIALPILIPGRVISSVLRKRRHLMALARSLPYLLVLTTSWSLGELCGYAAGEGDSADRWK